MTTQNSTKGRPSVASGPPWGTNLMKPVEELYDEEPSTNDTQGVANA